MQIEDVTLKDSFSISLAARTYRFRQVDLMHEIFIQNKLELFDCAAVDFSNGTSSVITPPVAEIHNGRTVFIEGNTRALHSHCAGRKTMKALVVRGVNTSLPAKEIPLGDVFLCHLKLPAAWRQLSWNYKAFRNIEAAMHNHP